MMRKRKDVMMPVTTRRLGFVCLFFQVDEITGWWGEECENYGGTNAMTRISDQ